MHNQEDEGRAPRQGGERSGKDDAEGRQQTLTAYCLDLLDQLLEARAENRELAGGNESSATLKAQLNEERERCRNLAEQLEAIKVADGERETTARELAAANRVLAVAVGLPEESSVGQVAERVNGLNLALADHKRWVAGLLSELAGRRFKIGRRELLEHERKFFDEQNQVRE